MTDTEWFKVFDKTKDKFQWFIEEYFPGTWQAILSNREGGHRGAMIFLMNDVWFKLPDHKFNIKESPKGWNEFLFLITPE